MSRSPSPNPTWTISSLHKSNSPPSTLVPPSPNPILVTPQTLVLPLLPPKSNQQLKVLSMLPLRDKRAISLGLDTLPGLAESHPCRLSIILPPLHPEAQVWFLP
uniref:Uncharacterized protein n=1 Tax=Arundo donax TaxID=35708 RepID=A0A0A9FTB5_ARUDO